MEAIKIAIKMISIMMILKKKDNKVLTITIKIRMILKIYKYLATYFV